MFARRALITAGAAALAAGVSRPASALGPGHTLVVVFQRFAADWMNLLVPAGDASYGALRPSLAISDPLPLTGFFGLHPALAPLKTIYDAGDLAFIAATGWLPEANRIRSHFQAQGWMEAAAREGVTKGWLSRLLDVDSPSNNLWRALAAEAAVPASLQGFGAAVAVDDFANFTSGSVLANEATNTISTLADIAGSAGAVTKRLSQSMAAVQSAGLSQLAPANGASYPDTVLGRSLRTAATAIRSGLAPRVVTATSDDDWDTHVSQASRHNAALPGFAQAIEAFYVDLGSAMEDVTLVTMTEFGRKAKESFGGTDHGTASSMLVMSRRIAGAQVYGTWPGLNASALYQGEDLAPTTDYRSVLAQLLVQHLGIPASSVGSIFPGPGVDAAAVAGLCL